MWEKYIDCIFQGIRNMAETTLPILSLQKNRNEKENAKWRIFDRIWDKIKKNHIHIEISKNI